MHNGVSEQRADCDADCEVRAECELRFASDPLVNQTADGGEEDTDERRNENGLRTKHQTCGRHQQRIAELNSANLFAGAFFEDHTTDFSDQKERNTDADRTDQALGNRQTIRQKRGGNREQCNEEQNTQIHLQRVPVHEADDNQQGEQNTNDDRVGGYIQSQQCGYVSQRIERFDNGILCRDFRTAVPAFTTQEQPAENRNQIPPPDFLTAGHTVRSALDQGFVLRQP